MRPYIPAKTGKGKDKYQGVPQEHANLYLAIRHTHGDNVKPVKAAIPDGVLLSSIIDYKTSESESRLAQQRSPFSFSNLVPSVSTIGKVMAAGFCAYSLTLPLLVGLPLFVGGYYFATRKPNSNDNINHSGQYKIVNSDLLHVRESLLGAAARYGQINTLSFLYKKMVKECISEIDKPVRDENKIDEIVYNIQLQLEHAYVEAITHGKDRLAEFLANEIENIAFGDIIGGQMPEIFKQHQEVFKNQARLLHQYEASQREGVAPNHLSSDEEADAVAYFNAMHRYNR